MSPKESQSASFVTFRFLRILCVFSGLPMFRTEFFSRLNPILRVVYKFYVTLIELQLWISYIRIWGCFFNIRTMSSAVEAITAVVYVSQVMVRSHVLMYKRKDIDKYMETLDKLEYFQLGEINTEFLKLFKSQYRIALCACKGYWVANLTLTIATFFIRPIIAPPEKPLVPAIYPWQDVHVSMKYIYWALDNLLVVYSTSRSTAMDLFAMTLIPLHAAQAAFLKKRLENILDGTTSKLISDEKSRESMTAWVSSHCESLRQTEDAETILQPCLFVTYAFSLQSLVQPLFFVLAKGDMEGGQKAIAVGSFVGTTIFLGLLCSRVDELMEQHEAIGRLFDYWQIRQSSAWMIHYFKMISRRCNKPMRISALGLFDLCLKNFEKVVSRSVSLLATAWNFRNRVIH